MWPKFRVPIRIDPSTLTDFSSQNFDKNFDSKRDQKSDPTLNESWANFSSCVEHFLTSSNIILIELNLQLNCLTRNSFEEVFRYKLSFYLLSFA